MNRVTAFATITLLAVSSAALAQCSAHPTSAFAGRVKIPYPRPGGMASVTRLCGPQATRISEDLMAQGRRMNMQLRWVEVYEVRRWTSAFHDSIYQLRGLGFQQAQYRQFKLAGWNDAETLVYANRSGRYAGMIMQGRSATGDTALFALYGN